MEDSFFVHGSKQKQNAARTEENNCQHHSCSLAEANKFLTIVGYTNILQLFPQLLDL